MSARFFLAAVVLFCGGLTAGIITSRRPEKTVQPEPVEEQHVSPVLEAPERSATAPARSSIPAPQPEAPPTPARPALPLLAGELTLPTLPEYLEARLQLFREFDRVLDYRRTVDARQVRPLGVPFVVAGGYADPPLYESTVSLQRRFSRTNAPHGSSWNYGRFMLLGLRAGARFELALGQRSDGSRMDPDVLADLMLGRPGARIQDRAATREQLVTLAWERSIATEQLTRRLWTLILDQAASRPTGAGSVIAVHSDSIGPARLIERGTWIELDHALADLDQLDRTLVTRMEEYFP